MAEVLDELGYPREVTKTEVVSAFLQTIQRALNCLSAEEQKSRRNAIETLHECLLKDDGAGSLPPMDVLQAAWDEVILEKVMLCVSDSSEKCRELAIQLIREVAQSLTEVDCTLKETVSVMEARMGQSTVLEGSEEIRLQLYSLLLDVLLPECELSTLQNLIDPLHRIVAVTLFDQFHEVQKKACSLLIATAKRDPEVFGNKTGVFLKGLVPCLNHAHSRVRMAVFQAIDSMMQCGLTSSLVAQQLAPGTKPLAFDHNAAVREMFYTSVANWLNFESTRMSDEEIHQCVISGKIPRFHLPQLLPLLLLGITDDHIDIATLAYERLEGIGEMYRKFIDNLDTRCTHGRGGERFRTPEEDAKLMEKVMAEERKCQEKYERELAEAEEQRRLQRESEAGKSPSGSDNVVAADSESSQEPSLYQSLKSQTIAMEEELNKGMSSVEKTLDTDLQLSTGPGSIERLDSDIEPRGSDEKEPSAENHAPATAIEAVETKEENSSGASGLHILTNRELQGNEDSGTETIEKDTSEITDEGAVRKVDTSETGAEVLQLPRPWKGRANAGCRLMVEAFLRPMIEPALKELKQWTTPTRLSAARFLHTLMVLAEGLAKDHLDVLVPAFFSAVADDDAKIAKRIVATLHIIGFHVPPRKWLPLVLKPLGNSKTSQAQRANALAVMAAFLYGTPRKAIEEKHVVKISDKLYEKEVCCSNHSWVLNQLLSVVANLIQGARALCKSSSFKILVLLLCIQSVADGDAEPGKRCVQVLDDLAQALGMDSVQELYVEHVHSLLDFVTAGHEAWSSGLQGKLVFQTFLCNANDAVGPYLESFMPFLTQCLQSDQEPAIRVSFLQLLEKLFEKQGLESSWAALAPDVLSKLLIPCAFWRPGKAEAGVRYAAMVAVGAFLRQDLCSQDHMQEMVKTPDTGLVPVLRACLDEDDFLDVRRASTHTMYQYLRVFGPVLSDEERTDLIKILSKRMDDSSNLIRRCILPAVAMFFTTMPCTFGDSEVRDFLSFLAVHVDDEHPYIQEGVCRAMEACAVKKPDIIVEVVHDVCDLQRSPEFINRVLKAAKNIHAQDSS